MSFNTFKGGYFLTLNSFFIYLFKFRGNAENPFRVGNKFNFMTNNNPIRMGILMRRIRRPVTFYFMTMFALLCTISVALAQTSQTFNNNGTFTVPPNVTSITVEVWSGGGGGGAATGNPAVGGGGAGGSYVRGTLDVTPGQQFTVTVGAGGTSSTSTVNPGGASWFGSASTLYAVGGNAGATATTNNGIGAGGAAVSTGNVTSGTNTASYYGGGGGTAPATGTGGGGGGSAGSASNGNNATGITGGAAVTGGAAGKTAANSNTQTAADAPGGGGAGGRATNGTDRAGGAGGKGQVIVTYTYPDCSGLPGAGTATASVTNACANTPFTITANGATAYVNGITYQWYSSPSGDNNFQPITNANDTILTVNNQTVPTDYYLEVTCSNSGLSASGSTVAVGQNPANQCYCTASGSTTANQAINNFSTTNGITNITNNSSGTSPNGYVDYTGNTDEGMSVSAVQSATVNFSFASTGNTRKAIYVDWDQSGTFETSERVYSNTTNSQSVTGSFQVPADALAGATRMRVRTRTGTGAVPACGDETSGETEDYTFTVVALQPCSGMPDAGTATSSLGAACASDAFTLSSTGYTIASGLTYQWYSSPQGAGTFTPISGATAATYSLPGLTSATDYRFVVKCGTEDSSISNIVTLGYHPCYCIPSIEETSTSDEFITNVTFAGINNTTSLSGGNGHYNDYTSQVAQVVPGLQSTLSVTFHAYGEDYAYAFFDWDNSGIFGDGPNEVYTIASNFSANGPYTVSIPVPLSAAGTTIRMRVMVQYSYDSPDPCNDDYNLDYGETEDYSVHVQTLDQCTTVTAGAATTTATPVCPTTSFTLSAPGATLGAGITFKWQKRVPAGTGTWTNISDANEPSYTTTQNEATDYRMWLVCADGGSTDTTTVVTVNQNPPNQCYCTPSIADQYIYIRTVNFAGINQTSTGTNGGYASYISGTPANVTPNVASTITVGTHLDYEDANLYVFIDWNQDGYLDGPGEMYFIGDGIYADNNITTTASITPPIDALPGNTRMRVLLVSLYNDDGGAGNPCLISGPYDAGEAEDYTVNVAALPPCTGMPTAGTAQVSPTSGAPTSNFYASVTGNTSASSLAYQWQSSENGTDNWTNVSGATAPTSNITAISDYATTYYRLRVICTETSDTAYSTVTSFETVPVFVMPTSSSVSYTTCGGAFYDDGGSSGTYSNNANGTTTFYPSTPGAKVQLTFTSYNTESDYDFMSIYDGNSTSAPVLLNDFSGTGLPNNGNTYTSTAADGSLTILFTSDGSYNYDGWAATLGCSCTPPPAVTAASTAPSYCGNNDGSIQLSGLISSASYTVSYTKDGAPQADEVISSDASGNLTIPNLGAGAYTNIVCQTPPMCPTDPVSATLIDGPLPVTVSGTTDVTTCGVTDGTMTISGLQAGGSYSIDYNIGVIAQPTFSGTADASGDLTMSNLTSGTYSNIIVAQTGGCTSSPLGR